ncbi:MAG: transposase [Chloroflexi bacterium]|nr:transposase [Chloroflexota bacterium]
MKAWGAALPGCAAPSFHRVAAEHIPEELRPALVPLLRQIEHLTGEILGADKKIAPMCERYPETATLQQIVGVGPITSLTFVLTIEDARRFPKNREIGPYLGLVPRSRESGDRQPQLRITKEGDVALRRVLNQAAHYILGPFGPDSDLRRWGLAYAESGAGNAKKRAVVAVARRLAVLMLALWKSGEVYEPLRHAHAAEAA